MKIGDRVRFMKGTEEGIVTKMLDKSLVEVEIEDGFAIPVLESELVVVSADESTAFDSPSYNAPKQKQEKIQAVEQNSLKGFHFAIIPLNDEICSIYFLNPTQDDILLMANEVNGKNEEKTLVSEKVFAEHATKITERSMEHLNTWNPFSCTILIENNKWSIPIRPEKISIRIKAKSFNKEKTAIPYLNSKGYLIPLHHATTETVEPTAINPEKLKDSFFQSNEEANTFTKERSSSSGATDEVDLHIENIDPNHDFLPTKDILNIQISKFEEKLNQAIMAGLDQIIFIHGVGNGTLKNKIHKLLSQHDHIEFFKDTHKEKFGYGATLVKIK